MYMLYFQTPGVAEAELEKDVRSTLRRFLYTASGDPPRGQGWRPVLPKTAGFLDATTDPPTLPPWLTEADLDFYAGEFARTGFRGGLNWYRNLDRTWELMAPWHHAKVTRPALFVAGERDGVIVMMRTALDHLRATVPDLRKLVLLPGCGHWTQQERPAEVNAELLEFLAGLDRG
jgi:pimeloyl-ACP methyl ester carboxylesterase